MSSMQEIVEKEIAEMKQRYSEHWWPNYFSNFEHRLPGGFWRMVFEKSYDNLIGDDPGFMEYSSLLRSQTPRLFFDTIDRLLEEEGISKETVMNLKFHNRDLKRLYELTLPVFIKLREMGYLHYPDLIA